MECDAAYDEIMYEIKRAWFDGRITDAEHRKLVDAMHSSMKGNEDPRLDLDPILFKVLGEEFLAQEAIHEED